MEKEFLSEEVDRLIEERRFAALRHLLESNNPTDIAELFEGMPKERLTVLYRILPKEQAAEVFVDMSAEQQKLLIDSFSDYEIKQIFDEMYSDDTADIIEEMPANVVRRILANVTPDMRRSVNLLLRYPEDSAGSMMTTEYVALKRQLTVAEALSYIRKVAIDKETIYNCYVTDANRNLIGLVTAKTLLISDTDAVIGDIMEQNVISATTFMDKEQVARMFNKYDFLALPVVDGDNRLVGIITVDDAIDVIHEETEEDFAKMAAIAPTDKSYLRTSVWELWRTRIPWLLVLMVSATFTGWIISSFEAALAVCVVLTSFIPMLMGTGGNAGSQASVTVIRGLSTGELTYKDWFRVLFKEMRVSLLCGATLAVAAFAKLQLLDRWILGNDEITLTVSFIVSVTLLMTVVFAKLFGSTLPLLAERLGFDPAVMASPFITTVVDAISLVVYLSVASAILPI